MTVGPLTGAQGPRCGHEWERKDVRPVQISVRTSDGLRRFVVGASFQMDMRARFGVTLLDTARLVRAVQGLGRVQDVVKVQG
jgi:hypothetical protein